MKPLLCVGVDISAKNAHVYCLGQAGQAFCPPFMVEQSLAGYQEFEKTLRATDLVPEGILIVMEATGSYWMKMTTYLYEAGFGVSVINPAQAHYFAKALLQRAKTDALDAKLLALIAQKLQPPVWSPSAEIREQIYQRLAQRDDFQQMLQMERNRLHAVQHRSVLAEAGLLRHQTHIDWLKAQIAELDHELKAMVAQDPARAHSARLLATIPGIGPISTYWLLVATDNFTSCEKR